LSDILAESTERCVGCGATVPRITGPIHRYMISAPGCWALHGELSARLLGDPGAGRFRQLCVDAYAVQHPGTPSPQAIQSVAGHLISLYAQLELGLATEAAPGLLQRVTREKGQYHWLTPPSLANVRTIVYVLAELDRLPEAAHEWAADAWRAWAHAHEQVRAWYRRLGVG
jgi:hypothetical protein